MVDRCDICGMVDRCDICGKPLTVETHEVYARKTYILCWKCYQKWMIEYERKGLGDFGANDYWAWNRKFNEVFEEFRKEEKGIILTEIT